MALASSLCSSYVGFNARFFSNSNFDPNRFKCKSSNFPPLLHDDAKAKLLPLTPNKLKNTNSSLLGSIPPSWPKEFVVSQSRRLKFQTKFRPTLEDIFSNLCMPFTKPKGNIGPASTVAADIVTLGDSWLPLAITKAIIEPITAAEHQDWFKELGHKWKVYLRRNLNGDIDPQGQIWAAPYRWGTIVIAYKKTKFQKHNLPPIQDWADLWRPELAGRIAMVNSPREVIGAVLKYMGASYNTTDLDLQVAGGSDAVQQNLTLLARQVRLFDSMNYLRAFSVGDVWVAVGWSSDVLPVVKRMSNVAVIVPKSGASLWADLWVIPAASRLETNRIGGRVRGPSPVIHQWVEFCLQAARALPFKQGVIPGASPSAMESVPFKLPEELTKDKPKLDTNLVAGVPPPEILERCEFLEPLPDRTLEDYQRLIDNIPKSEVSFMRIIEHISSVIRTLRLKFS
ncbi:Bacterial periplasmic spermidine/putrescine-binding protein [Corchorus olitorius]|uniref:Bacterial periplasmic spermidine/putrescine-binding protein n=1 Tax=Corchorus olitorius TaxID=93759 RepID=A0A1R3JFX8_9ROSI|nr:Bacterial periplasmic spermidine/putrescine-binding protein [Corchorus olitorius]